jgi:hypothetical protein
MLDGSAQPRAPRGSDGFEQGGLARAVLTDDDGDPRIEHQRLLDQL